MISIPIVNPGNDRYGSKPDFWMDVRAVEYGPYAVHRTPFGLPHYNEWTLTHMPTRRRIVTRPERDKLIKLAKIFARVCPVWLSDHQQAEHILRQKLPYGIIRAVLS